MATLQPYQRTLLENRDSLLTEVRTDQVVPLLFVSHVLNQKEIDNIDVGRTWNERAESLLDVLHYKGERGFREFCNALEDPYPHLATKLKASRPQVEVPESDSRQSSSVEKHIYSVPHKERTKSSEQLGGEFGKRQERESDAGNTSRSQRETQEMRGDQSYERKPHQGSRENMHRYYDGGRFDDRGQYGGNLNLGQVEHDRSSQGSSERGFRRSATDLDLQPGPGEQEVMEKQTIVLEKAHAGQGFGIAVSGGRDNPHKVSGDPAIVVSDIIPNSPAAGLLRTGDIISQVNDRDVENVMHSTAVQALKDSGNSARLIIKRRKIVSIQKKESTPLKTEPQHITLIRDKVKGYGFSLGHQLFIKEIDEKGVAANDGGIRSGDVLMKINDKRTDELTLRSAIDLVRNSKDRLDLVVVKQDGGDPSHFSSHSLPASYRHKDKPHAVHNGYDEERVPDIPGRFYDQEDAKPARPPPPDESEKGMPFAGLDTSWKRPGPPSEPQDTYDRRLEEPLQVHVPADVTHSAPVPGGWNHSSPITKMTTSYVESGPSTPRGSMDGRKSQPYRGDARLVTFRKSGSLGIQVQGGNKVGIFVAAVKEGSAAHDKGLRKGDQILMANDIDFKDITREEAVLILLSLGDEVSLLAQHKRAAFDKISKEPGDDFHIKAHFNYEAPASKPEELSFNKEDVFHVTDTMFNGVIGSWHAKLVDKMMNVETESGVVPNKCRAEQLAVVEQKKEEKTPQKFSTGSLKRSSFKGGSLRKNYQFRSTDKLDMAAFDTTVREIQLPAYERVQRKHPGFVRPVVLLGPIADITRDKLLQDMPDVYAVPGGYQYSSGKSQKRSYNYRDIREIIDAGKHCLLDISPDEVERLNYAQLYPIVIFLKPPSKQMVKEMRAQYGQSNKHIKQLYDNAVKLEEFYYNVFHAKITAGVMDNWYGRVKEEISKQQQDLVWMTEDKVEDDEHEDMVFHGPGRYSQVFDNDSTHYDSNLDSPTIRSSVSTQPVDEDIVHVAEQVRTVQSAAPPRDERNMRQAYSEPYISYNGQDADRYDDRRRDHYDDRYDRDRDRYDGRPPYDDDDDIEKASRPGYKPSGNIVNDRKDRFPETAAQVLPSSEKPTDLRQSLRKSLPPRDSGEWDGQYETEINRTADGLRRSEPLQRLDQPSELEAQVRNKRDALRKVEDDSDLLRQYDERVGVKVSDLWTIDNESRGRYDRREPTRRTDDEPAVSIAVKSNKNDDDLDKRLEQLEEVAARQPPMTKPKPTTFRNTIVDYRSEDRPERVAHTTRYPVKSFATHVKHFERDEPEVRVQTSAPVSSVPRYQDDRREYPDDQVIRVGEPEARFGSRPSEPRQTYRAEVTIPTKRDSKPERPRSGYSSHAYAPKPFAASEVQVGQTYDFKLSRPQVDSSYSSLKRDEDRYGYGGMTDLDKLDHGKDDQQNVVTSDFESLEDETQVVATARGRFTSKGGVLSSPESGVSIVIPEGAIPKGQEQEIYFKVCKDNNFMPPLDADKGETLLSPLVMCGPHGTQFLKPVELRLPHCASMTPDGWSFALKSSDTPSGDPFSNSSSPPSQWKNLSLQGQDPQLDQCKVDNTSVSVLVDHF